MSTTSGSMHLSPLHGVVWPLEQQPVVEAQFLQYRGRDNHIGIVWLDGGQAMLRVYDEFTQGGRILVAETPRVAPALPGTTVAVGDPMPAELVQPVPPPEYVFVSVSTGAADIDLASWAPVGLTLNQRVQIRKVDSAIGALKYTCPDTGIAYKFADKRGEFITLLWTGSSFRII